MKDNVLKLPGIAESEEVELFWICSPKRTVNGNWELPVFIKNNEQNSISLRFWSIGNLPLFRMGHIYVNGRMSNNKAVGDVMTSVTIPPNIQGSLIPAIEMANRLKYYLYREKRIMNEYVWTFSIKGIEYYIPCLEILRTYFAVSNTMARAVMSPHKIDSFVDKEKSRQFGNTIHLQLTTEWPRELLRTGDIAHLLWVRENKAARNSWNSIYENVLYQTIGSSDRNKELRKGIPIQLIPPIDVEHKWKFRGISKGKHFLIKEITNIMGLDFSFDEITYNSPWAYISNSTTNQNDIESNPKNKAYTAFIDDEDGAKLGQSALSFAIPGCTLEFSRPKSVKRHLERRTLSVKETSNADKMANNALEGNNEKIYVSADNPREFGQNRRLEFKRLEIADITPGESLQNFVKSIFILNKYTHSSLNTYFVNLPRVGPAALDKYGQQRICAFVHGQTTGDKSFVILEVGSADVSTLLVFLENAEKLENIIESLLEGLVENDGHWNNKLISSNRNLYRFKHMGDRNLENAKRLIRRIGTRISEDQSTGI